MKWAKEPPTAPGWYGWRDGTDSDFIRYDGTAYFGANGNIIKGYCLLDGEWCGPLSEMGDLSQFLFRMGGIR